MVQPGFDALVDTWISPWGKHRSTSPNDSHIKKPSADQCQDEVMVLGPSRGELRDREVVGFQKVWFGGPRGLNFPTYEPVPPPIRQDGRVDVDALGVNAVFFVKRRHLADCALDIVRFVPRRIVEERDIGLLGGCS